MLSTVRILRYFFLQQKLIDAKKKKRELHEDIKEFAKEGNMRGICNRLVKAQVERKLENKYVLLGLMQSVSKNFHVKGNKGKRYEKSLKKFYESLMIMGGPRIAMFVSMNLEGPMMSSIYNWRKLADVNWSRVDIKTNILIAHQILEKAIERSSLTGPLPAETSEDETYIIGRTVYDQKSDQLLGMCGLKGQNHQCSNQVSVVVGEGEDGYTRIVDTFDTIVVAK